MAFSQEIHSLFFLVCFYKQLTFRRCASSQRHIITLALSRWNSECRYRERKISGGALCGPLSTICPTAYSFLQRLRTKLEIVTCRWRRKVVNRNCHLAEDSNSELRQNANSVANAEADHRRQTFVMTRYFDGEVVPAARLQIMNWYFSCVGFLLVLRHFLRVSVRKITTCRGMAVANTRLARIPLKRSSRIFVADGLAVILLRFNALHESSIALYALSCPATFDSLMKKSTACFIYCHYDWQSMCADCTATLFLLRKSVRKLVWPPTPCCCE